MQSKQPRDLISVTEARRLLRVSRIKIAELIKKNVIRTFPYPLDRRVKLISKAEIEALKKTRLMNNGEADSSVHLETKAAA